MSKLKMKVLSAAAVMAAVSFGGSVQAQPVSEGIRWNHRPSPVYCETARGGTITNPPPYGSCYRGIWVYDSQCTSWYFRASHPGVC